jgi:cation transport ATPase
MYSRTSSTYQAAEFTPTLINWRSVFGGAVIGIGLMILLSALWLALSFQSNVDWVRDNLEWFLGGTAILALFVAGYMAGFSSGARGIGAGLAQAFTLWSLITIVTLAVGVPTVFRTLNIDEARLGLETDPIWAGFWTMLIALGACLVGGLLGGATPRRSQTMATTGVAPAPVATAAHHDDGHVHDEDDHDEDDHDHVEMDTETRRSRRVS